MNELGKTILAPFLVGNIEIKEGKYDVRLKRIGVEKDRMVFVRTTGKDETLDSVINLCDKVEYGYKRLRLYLGSLEVAVYEFSEAYQIFLKLFYHENHVGE